MREWCRRPAGASQTPLIDPSSLVVELLIMQRNGRIPAWLERLKEANESLALKDTRLRPEAMVERFGTRRGRQEGSAVNLNLTVQRKNVRQYLSSRPHYSIRHGRRPSLLSWIHRSVVASTPASASASTGLGDWYPFLPSVVHDGTVRRFDAGHPRHASGV